ncbi:MAG TPA: ABC transporter ATP-binding protein [Rhodopila sp.]|uniref:ABC transporter ATP-binding protein n=1 Tax=Rhodopila sp. TaxID=2480087 RepID=UPI002C3939CA|nr:ABC transporter ATP-binding protein [Rhodopila sp.]HVY16938.1 ABC transporter ATP-binding protein [Rhodopila sp.]
MSAILQVSGLTKRFGGIVVADDITLGLLPGEVVGLIGPNGAGKTSLFNLITGVIKPDAGRIVMDGVRIDGLKLSERAKLGIARTWQHARSFRSLTVLDNLLLGARDYPGDSLLRTLLQPGISRRMDMEAEQRAMLLLERVRLAHKAHDLAAELSYGQQKLLGMARALMSEGACLLLDEPMAAVEGRTYAIMREVIEQEAHRGQAVCIVEHNVGFIRDLCSRGVFMAAGKVLADGPVEELMKMKDLTALYFGAAA